jgi:predicted double-glycine peptidase
MLSFVIAALTAIGVYTSNPAEAITKSPAMETRVVSVATTTPVSKKADTIVAKTSSTQSSVVMVPFYSQFKDIASAKWQKVGCGIASLAMIIDYYKPAVSVESLLKQGINSGAYLDSAGWTHQGLINISKKYGLNGSTVSLAHLNNAAALAEFKKHLKDGPVMASIHYKFDPQSTIPHLVVINSIDGDIVSYNDPADKSGNSKISTDKFMKAWKKRFIEIRPVAGSEQIAKAK